MRLYLISILVLIVLPLVVVLLTVTALGFHVGDLWSDLVILRQQENRLMELTAKMQEVKPRLDAESAIMNGLCAQKITLAQAIRQMRELRTQTEMDFVIDKLREVHPDAKSDAEVLCRQLIRVAATRLAGNPKQDKVVSGLEAAMAAYLHPNCRPGRKSKS